MLRVKFRNLSSLIRLALTIARLLLRPYCEARAGATSENDRVGSYELRQVTENYREIVFVCMGVIPCGTERVVGEEESCSEGRCCVDRNCRDCQMSWKWLEIRIMDVSCKVFRRWIVNRSLRGGG